MNRLYQGDRRVLNTGMIPMMLPHPTPRDRQVAR